MGKRLTLALAVFALIVIPLAIYTAGYFCLPENVYWFIDGCAQTSPVPGIEVQTIERQYPQLWMVTAFRPATKLEGWLRGVEVQATWRDPILRGLEP